MWPLPDPEEPEPSVADEKRYPFPVVTITNPDKYRDLATRGRCVGGDPEIWFSGTYGHPNRDPGEQALNPKAQAACKTCPVRELCWEYAVETAPDYGVWGGRPASDAKAFREGRRMRRTCERCGRRRMDKFYPDDVMTICVDCLYLPPDDDLEDMMREASDAELRDILDVTAKTLEAVKQRMDAEGLDVGSVNRWKRSGRDRLLPGDNELREAFLAGRAVKDIAAEWGVWNTTVYAHKYRLFPDGLEKTA